MRKIKTNVVAVDTKVEAVDKKVGAVDKKVDAVDKKVDDVKTDVVNVLKTMETLKTEGTVQPVHNILLEYTADKYLTETKSREPHYYTFLVKIN